MQQYCPSVKKEMFPWVYHLSEFTAQVKTYLSEWGSLKTEVSIIFPERGLIVGNYNEVRHQKPQTILTFNHWKINDDAYRKLPLAKYILLSVWSFPEYTRI